MLISNYLSDTINLNNCELAVVQRGLNVSV